MLKNGDEASPLASKAVDQRNPSETEV